jgi:hypothetical protein
MSNVTVPDAPAPALSDAAEVGRIVGGAVLGALGGMVMAGVVYASLVVAVFGALGGAVCGMIAAARTVEPR